MGKDKNMDMRLIYYYGDRDISKETRYKIAELIESDLENKSDSTSSIEAYEDSSLVPVYKKIIFDRLDMYGFPPDKKIVFLNSLEDGDVIKKVIETSHEHISAIIDHELYKYLNNENKNTINERKNIEEENTDAEEMIVRLTLIKMLLEHNVIINNHSFEILEEKICKYIKLQKGTINKYIDYTIIDNENCKKLINNFKKEYGNISSNDDIYSSIIIDILKIISREIFIDYISNNKIIDKSIPDLSRNRKKSFVFKLIKNNIDYLCEDGNIYSFLEKLNKICIMQLINYVMRKESIELNDDVDIDDIIEECFDKIKNFDTDSYITDYEKYANELYNKIKEIIISHNTKNKKVSFKPQLERAPQIGYDSVISNKKELDILDDSCDNIDMNKELDIFIILNKLIKEHDKFYDLFIHKIYDIESTNIRKYKIEELYNKEYNYYDRLVAIVLIKLFNDCDEITIRRILIAIDSNKNKLALVNIVLKSVVDCANVYDKKCKSYGQSLFEDEIDDSRAYSLLYIILNNLKNKKNKIKKILNIWT